MNKIIDKMINLLNKSNLKLDKTSIGSYDDLKKIDNVNIKNLMKFYSNI